MDTRRRFFRVGLGASLIASLSLGSVGVASGAGLHSRLSAHAASGPAKIEVQNTLAGSVITDPRGYVLFVFPLEHGSNALCVAKKKCMTDWPAVTTVGRPIAGPGVNAALLGTIPYKGKLRQVTYDGRPLHTYKFAYSAESSVMNIGIKQFGGPWDALTVTGGLIK